MKQHTTAIREVIRTLRKTKRVTKEDISKLIQNNDAIDEFYNGHKFIPIAYKKTEYTYSIDLIISTVCQIFECSIFDVKKKCRLSEIVNARYLIVYILRNENGLTCELSGHQVNIDHSTVLYACNKVERLIMEDGNFKIKKDKVFELLKKSVTNECNTKDSSCS